MEKYLKVKEVDNLVRDSESLAILNIDNKELRMYKQRKQREAVLDRLVEEHNEMRHDLNEIKTLLKVLIGQK